MKLTVIVKYSVMVGCILMLSASISWNSVADVGMTKKYGIFDILEASADYTVRKSYLVHSKSSDEDIICYPVPSPNPNPDEEEK